MMPSSGAETRRPGPGRRDRSAAPCAVEPLAVLRIERPVGLKVIQLAGAACPARTRSRCPPSGRCRGRNAMTSAGSRSVDAVVQQQPHRRRRAAEDDELHAVLVQDRAVGQRIGELQARAGVQRCHRQVGACPGVKIGLSLRKDTTRGLPAKQKSPKNQPKTRSAGPAARDIDVRPMSEGVANARLVPGGPMRPIRLAPPQRLTRFQFGHSAESLKFTAVPCGTRRGSRCSFG